MIFGIVVLATIVVGILTSKKYRKEEFRNLDKEKHPFLIFYPLAQKIFDSYIQVKKFAGWKEKCKDGCRDKYKDKYKDKSKEESTGKSSTRRGNLEKVSRIAIVLFSITITTGLYIIVSAMEPNVGETNSNVIKRPDYVYNSALVDINVYKEGEAVPYEIELSIPARKYTMEEADRNFEKAREYLQENILKKNMSLDKIKGDLELITEIEKYSISIDWRSSDQSIVNYDGSVNNKEFERMGVQSVDIELTAVMKYDSYEYECPLSIVVLPPDISEGERFENNIRQAISGAFEDSIHDEEVSLPSEVDGVRLEYRINKNSSAGVIAFLGLISGAVLLYGTEVKKKKEKEEREKQMKYDYSEVVAKLTLLLGAGMTVSRAWEKITTDYRNQLETCNIKMRYAYEEMQITYFQMKTGVQETKAYAEFGKRCGVREYLKLGALLEQNIKKGTRGLAKMLEDETAEAFEDRKNIARRLGEEAGTKLLIPMIIMLVIVMIIVTVPAFMSFGI